MNRRDEPPESHPSRSPAHRSLPFLMIVVFGVLAACTELPPAGERPIITSTIPSDGAAGVSVDVVVRATATVPGGGSLSLATLTDDSVRLRRQSDGEAVSGSIGLDGGATITFDPTDDLEPGTAYVFRITNAVSDEQGNALVPYVMSFTTGAERPSIASTIPADGATGVVRDVTIRAFLDVPGGGGVEASTLTPSSVTLERDEGGLAIAGQVGTSGGNDVISFQPFGTLQENTTYTFRVTALVEDENGNAFLPFEMRFTTGTGLSVEPAPVSFSKTQLFSGPGLASVVIGPDDRLYATGLDGMVRRWTIDRANPTVPLGDGEVYAGFAGRALIGIAFDPTDDDVIWVTDNATLAVQPAPEFSGRIAKITMPGGSLAGASHIDYVVGLPRSEKDHLSNSLVFGPDGLLYMTQGSNTGAGSPDSFWGNRPERLLTAAVLQIDPRRTTGLPIDVQTEDHGATTGSYDPYAPSAPVKLYATGLRNAYDLAWHTNGRLYVPTNGTNPVSKAPAIPGDPNHATITDITSQPPDFLYVIDPAEPDGYFGHPNPSRGEYVLNGGNPTGFREAGDEILDYTAPRPPEANYRGFGEIFPPGEGISINGVIQYRSGVFGPTLLDDLLIARFTSGDIVAVSVQSDGTVIRRTDKLQVVGGLNRPLDLIEDVLTGNLYVVELRSDFTGRIQLLRANAP